MTVVAPSGSSERRHALLVLTGLFSAAFVCVGLMVHTTAALLLGVALGLAAAIPAAHVRYPDAARSLANVAGSVGLRSSRSRTRR